ncbi:MAG: energy transducer TonB [Limisphaerales bacterium]
MQTPLTMSSQVQDSRWPFRRWVVAVAVVFAAQAGLILWLGERGPVRSRPPGATPALRLAGGISAEALALQDPTLFVLPHLQGYSGPAWLKVGPVPNRPSDWWEAPRTLPVCVTRLGAPPSQQLETNRLAPLGLAPALEPGRSLPDPLPLPLSPEQSRLRIEGDLAGYRLLTTLNLPSWQYDDVLTNTGVEMVVDAEGRPCAATVLFSSGYPKADDHALAQARTARFDIPSPPPGQGAAPSTSEARLIRGLLLFDWHTVPLPPTNAPPIK